MLTKIMDWFGQNPRVVIAAIICLALVLVAAMAFHYDLSWIPELLRSWTRR